MTLNIGGGFSLLRCASTTLSSLFCAMPRCYAPFQSPEIGQSQCSPVPVRIGPGTGSRTCGHPNQCGGAVQCDKVTPSGRITVLFHGLGDGWRVLTAPGGARKRRCVWIQAVCLP